MQIKNSGAIVGLATKKWFGIKTGGKRIFAYNDDAELELFQRPDFAEFVRIIRTRDMGRQIACQDLDLLTALEPDRCDGGVFFAGRIGNAPVFVKKIRMLSVVAEEFKIFAARVNSVSQTGLMKYYGHTEIDGERAIITNLVPQLSKHDVEAFEPEKYEKIQHRAQLAKQIYETFGIYDSDFQVVIDKFDNPKVIDFDQLHEIRLFEAESSLECRDLIRPAIMSIWDENCLFPMWRNDFFTDSSVTDKIRQIWNDSAASGSCLNA